MAESVRKGLKSLELNGMDAHLRDSCSEISVEGYDTSLQNYAIKLTLRKYFASCGEILLVSVFKSFALMRFEGKAAGPKALALSGTDVGGWIPIVKSAPWQSEPVDYSAPRIKPWMMFVSGYDTGLPKIDIQVALCKHFSSCGQVTGVSVLSSGRALIAIKGEGCEEKALELRGSVMGGMTLVVEPQKQYYPASPGKRQKSTNKSVGYLPESIKLELEIKKKKKYEKKKKKKLEKKEKEMKKMEMEEKEKEMKKMEMEEKEKEKEEKEEGKEMKMEMMMEVEKMEN